ncbi:type II toxin-antitoxin system RelE/ParE family toxin [Planktothrix agardhii]|jgi:phage-related protein|uniref:type II toxin-antitoxin system RelE/ParE family toxin n=1 Tax=Planktothrix agardhii TaxID=1160 RepID=UPI001D09FF60|nr:type II toxin-antitoxin system RelE/ParE family toxin [Planktothrix agardhii]MCB8785350.1 type II toxin-antitoxin system RelE/ParE family toxin [Planktothrix agardhii 1025]MCF3578790.1 type II toxin-antitoxin system RelE/ParE family toxin [Planktothrix agardhii 1812]MCF3612930.1 type II toxin-antitoxin system RelE/ParE family toxin [Planktothrix agardhii 1027]MCF3646812.1 type II toxin-antitoxin system RelE/ParE family toxin [Planktothrix agardhii 1026]CAD5940672.1 hypothetical protein NO2A
MTQPSTKPVQWIGSSKDDLSEFPKEVRDVIGYALYLAQMGSKYKSAKPLKGFGSAGVLEIIDDYDGNTYRAVYTVKFPGIIYVLHVFQKKSTQGISTRKQDMQLIQQRLKLAEEDYKSRRNQL